MKRKNCIFFLINAVFLTLFISGCKKGDTSNTETNNSVHVTGITITPPTLITYKDVRQQLGVDVVPNNATNQALSWTSSNTTVALVTSGGVVIGSSPGSTVITATSQDGGFKSTCSVTIPQRTTVWPDSLSTAIQPGIVLNPGLQRWITVDNSVVEGERIIATTFTQYCGGLTINAKNVTVRNCWITASFGTGLTVNGTGVIKVLPGASVTIEHCILDGDNRTHAGIWYEGANVIARNNNIYKTNDGIFVWYANNFDFEDNYVHNLTIDAANGHIDGFQTEGSMHGILKHNSIMITQGQNACVNIYAGSGNTDDILVENNLLAGGGFSAYAFDDSPSESSPAGGYSTTNIRFINNAFTRIYYPYVGYYGVWYPRGNTTDACVWLGNYVVETNENIDAKQPAGCTEAFPH